MKHVKDMIDGPPVPLPYASEEDIYLTKLNYYTVYSKTKQIWEIPACKQTRHNFSYKTFKNYLSYPLPYTSVPFFRFGGPKKCVKNVFQTFLTCKSYLKTKKIVYK